MSNTPSQFDFDAALSFAGEDRAYAEEVNGALRRAGVRTFLDADYLSETWGEDLVEFFDSVYRTRSCYAILFISRHYAEKAWPRHERRSAIARALDDRAAYVLPVRLDDTEVDGLRPTVGYLDARRVGIDGLVAALIAKLHGRTLVSSGYPGERVPRTEEEASALVATRPPAWEYLYFAGVWYVAKANLEDRYLDYEIGYAGPSGRHVDPAAVRGFLDQQFDEVRRLVALLTSLMEPEVQGNAFGEPGEAGDAERILKLADRLNSIYADLLAWAFRIRGASRNHEYDRLFDLQARFVDKPIRQYREFIDSLVASLDAVPAELAAGRDVKLDLTLKLSIGDGFVEQFNMEKVDWSNYTYSR